MLYEVPLIDTFTSSVSRNIIKKTVVVDTCQEGLCHEGEVPDLMALKTAYDVGNFMKKHFNGGNVSIAKEYENSLNSVIKHESSLKTAM